MRNKIAIGICTVTAAVGVLILLRVGHAAIVTAAIATVWHTVGDWLDQRWGMYRLTLNMQEVLKKAKLGALSSQSPIVRTIDRTSTLLFLVSFVCIFTT